MKHSSIADLTPRRILAPPSSWRAFLAALSVALAALCLGPSGGQAADEGVSVGDKPLLEIGASFVPSPLPAGAAIPVVLRLQVRLVRKGFVGPLPGVSGLMFRLDPAVDVDLSRRPDHPRAPLGRGTFLVQDHAGGTEPTRVKGRWSIRAPTHADRHPSAEFVLPAPVDETFRIPLKVHRGSDRRGSPSGAQMDLALPPFDEGRATLLSLSLTLGTGPGPDGTSPVVSARCPGDGDIEILAEATLDTGAGIGADLLRPCRRTSSRERDS